MKIHITAEQEAAIGQIVADNFGGHFQTGIADDGIYVACKKNPNISARYYIIAPDGSITIRPAATITSIFL